MAADNVIDESVVRIGPDLKGFRRDLQAKLKAAVAGVTAKVKLQADATGWAASVRKELAARPQDTAKVRLVADARSFQRSINEALRARGGVHGMVAGTSGGGTGGGGTGGGSVKPSFGERGGLANALHINERITQNLREHLSRRRNLQEGYEADRTRAQDADLQRQLKRFRSYQEMIDHLHAQGDAWELRRTRSAAEEHARVREAAFKAEEKLQQDAAVKRQRIEERYSTFQEKVNGELRAMSMARADDERRIAGETEDARHRIDLHGLTLRRQVLAAGEAADKESNKRSEQEQKKSLARRATAKPSAALKATEGNGIIDLGGQGIKPSNIPLAALAALSPALLSIASSATLAASSVAAIGAAGIGAAAGVTALVVGFSRIREALTLRQQVRKEEQRSTIATAESAAAERSRARAIVMGNRSVRDSIRSLAEARRSAADADKAAGQARADINVAYRDAAQYVRDLREQLSDLARQEQQDALDVASAKDRLASVNNNFWATDLEKRQAALDVQKALDDQSDNKRDEVAKRKELNKLDRDGIGQSKQVLEARQRAADAERAAVDAHRAVAAAQERVADTQYDLTEAKRADTDATTKATAASKDLAAKIASLSPAAREMYYWFKNNEGMLDKLRSKMEQAVLPGFLTFLREITDRGKRGRGTSSLDIMADSAARLGKIAGSTVGKLGKLTKSPWFRKDMAKINTENEKSFTLLGDASLAFVKPLTTIIRAASPLFTRFSKWLLKITNQFAAFIDKADKNGTLVQWFKDAGDEAAKWGRVLTNLLGFLKSVFSASLPSGKDLVTRIGDATAALDKWGKSPTGQAQLAKFFKFFQDLDYKKIATFVGSFGTLIGFLKVFTFGRQHPFYSLMALFAAKYPEGTADLLSRVAGGMRDMLTWVDKHPGQAATVLAILTAVRYWKPISIGFKLLGLGEGLAGKIAAAFGKSITTTMYVTAGVVNVAGGGGLPGKLGKGAAAAGGAAAVAEGGALTLTAGTVTIAALGVLSVAAAGTLAFKSASGRWPWETPPPGPVTKEPHGLGAATDITPINEAKAFQPLKKQAAEFANRGIRPFLKDRATGDFSADRNVDLQRYIVSRKQAVKLNWFDVASKKGVIEADKDMAKETNRSVTTLREMLVAVGWSTAAADKYAKAAYGWKDAQETANKSADGAVGNLANVLVGLGQNRDAAEKYARKILGIPEIHDTKLGLPKISDREQELKNVNKQIDLLTGTKTAIVKILPGSDADKQLEKLVIQQMALSNPNLGGLQGAKNLYDKQKKLAMMAGGGPVRGSSPNRRADNIPAMLTAREYVHPVDSVDYYGTGIMDAIRRREIPREAIQNYALGGVVAPGANAIGSRWPFAVKLPEPTLGPGVFTGKTVGSLDVARIAEAQARAMGASNKQLLALIEAGIVESGMRNLNYGDRDSIGFLQQRAGWGSRAERMNVAMATAKFIRAAKHKDRKRYTAGQLAQAVQVSAFPDRYDKREADAYNIINKELPGIGITGGAGGDFPPWPSSPGAQRGNSGVWKKVVALAKTSGYPVRVTSTYRKGDPLWHGSGRAADFGGYNQDPLAQFFMNRKAQVLELIHRTKKRDYGVKRGHDGQFPTQWPLHRNHLHVAMAGGGLVPNVPMKRYDTGGPLEPGLTLAMNGTGRTETVRTATQEKNVNEPRRLDKRDIALLAQYIAAASQRPINMDGRRVAEIVHDHNYLPGGV